jgi:rubredoxin
VSTPYFVNGNSMSMHFECVLCGSKYRISLPAPKEPESAARAIDELVGDFICLSCRKDIESANATAQVSEWERDNGLYD